MLQFVFTINIMIIIMMMMVTLMTIMIMVMIIIIDSTEIKCNIRGHINLVSTLIGIS